MNFMHNPIDNPMILPINNPNMINDIFYKITEMENRIKKIEQKINTLELNNNTNNYNNEPDNNMYMI